MNKKLIARLTDPDEETRAAAYEEVDLDMNDEVAETIAGIALGDAADDIREHAMIALGPVIEECGMDYADENDPVGEDLGPPVSRERFQSIVTRMRSLYDDAAQPKLIRRRAFEVLVRDPQEWQRAEVRKHWSSSDPDWRVTAVFAMGMMSGWDGELLEAINGSDDRLVFEAVRSAGLKGLRAAAPRIRALVESNKTDHELRLSAIEALPHVDKESYDTLERLTHSRNQDVADVAQMALDELELYEHDFDDLDEESN